MNQVTRSASSNLHSEADKSQSIGKSLVYIFGFTRTILCILQFLALSKVKTFQREIYSALMVLEGMESHLRYPNKEEEKQTCKHRVPQWLLIVLKEPTLI